MHARFETYAKLSKKIGQEMVASIAQIDFTDPGRIADAVAAQIGSKISDRQTLLETGDIRKRLDLIHALIEAEIEVLKVERKIRTRVKTQMERSQREYYLNEQMKAIQRELGEGSDREEDDADNFRSRIMATKFSKEAKAKALGELRKLRSMSPMSAESTVVRSYIEWLLDVPWKKASRVNRDLKKAETILNEDHYGLEKVKERILEHLAVQQRTKRGTVRSSASLARREWERPRSANPWPVPRAGSSFGWRSAEFGTRRKSVAIAVPTSVPCPGASSRA